MWGWRGGRRREAKGGCLGRNVSMVSPCSTAVPYISLIWSYLFFALCGMSPHVWDARVSLALTRTRAKPSRGPSDSRRADALGRINLEMRGIRCALDCHRAV